jgi:hypothetical protein
VGGGGGGGGGRAGGIGREEGKYLDEAGSLREDPIVLEVKDPGSGDVSEEAIEGAELAQSLLVT